MTEKSMLRILTSDDTDKRCSGSIQLNIEAGEDDATERIGKIREKLVARTEQHRKVLAENEAALRM